MGFRIRAACGGQTVLAVYGLVTLAVKFGKVSLLSVDKLKL
jgi:hypothetical protein